MSLFTSRHKWNAHTRENKIIKKLSLHSTFVWFDFVPLSKQRSATRSGLDRRESFSAPILRVMPASVDDWWWWGGEWGATLSVATTGCEGAGDPCTRKMLGGDNVGAAGSGDPSSETAVMSTVGNTSSNLVNLPNDRETVSVPPR